MRIISRNFIRLLSAGAFHTEEPIEEMSPFKWKELLTLAEANNVYEFISTGIVAAIKQDERAIPNNIIGVLDIKDSRGEDKSTEQDSRSALTQAQTKKFASLYLSHRFNKINSSELHSIDTSVESLAFLNILIDNANTLLNKGIDLRLLTELGLTLRRDGDKIDFIKIEKWVKSLSMGHILNIIGSCLVSLFKFETSEIPFLKHYYDTTYDNVCLYLDDTQRRLREARAIIGKDADRADFLPLKPRNTTFKHLGYFPLEAMSVLVYGAARSISNIEE